MRKNSNIPFMKSPPTFILFLFLSNCKVMSPLWLFFSSQVKNLLKQSNWLKYCSHRKLTLLKAVNIEQNISAVSSKNKLPPTPLFPHLSRRQFLCRHHGENWNLLVTKDCQTKMCFICGVIYMGASYFTDCNRSIISDPMGERWFPAMAGSRPSWSRPRCRRGRPDPAPPGILARDPYSATIPAIRPDQPPTDHYLASARWATNLA